VLEIPSISREYVYVPVAGAAGTEPVDIAFVGFGAEPGEPDWQTAEWSSGSARVLVGPDSDVVLADGLYEVWVRVTAAPELPAVKSGLLRIT
jgi:hypothetical protein